MVQETFSSETKRQAAIERIYRSDMALVELFFASMRAVLRYFLFQAHGIAPTGQPGGSPPPQPCW